MSFEAINATYQLLPGLTERLKTVDSRRRPGHANAALVALLLADRYRNSRGYCDESVDQIASTLGLKRGTVRNVLAALDQLGLWVKVGKGNQHGGTRRRPTFLTEHREVPHDAEGEGSGEASCGKRTMPDADDEPEHREVAPGASRGSDTSNVRSGAHHPVIPQCPRENIVFLQGYSNAADGLDDDDIQLAIEHIERHIDWNGWKQDDSERIRVTQTYRAIELVGHCRGDGSDPVLHLELNWATGPPEGTEAGDWEPDEPVSLLDRKRHARLAAAGGA